MRSLRGRLIAVWLLLLAAAVAIAVVFVAFYRQTIEVQLARAEDAMFVACAEMGEQYSSMLASRPEIQVVTPALRSDLTSIVVAELARVQGMEGGFWSAAEGSLAYAYPTYAGTGPKTDVPAAELSTIAETNRQARVDAEPVVVSLPTPSQILLLAACPMAGPLPAITAWTMTRVHSAGSAAYQTLLVGLGLLAGVMILSAILLGRVIWTWSRRIASLEKALAEERDTGDLPVLPETGEYELDRLVGTLNRARNRLADARDRAATAERYAVAGRLAAGMAHEIRNPIAAMRLKAENGLAAADVSRKDVAFDAIVQQIARLDALLRDLLSMTQRGEPRRASVEITAIIQRCVEAVGVRAEAQGIRLTTRVSPSLSNGAVAQLDADQIVSGLENLLVNAIQHTPAGRAIWIEALDRGGKLLFVVGNDGARVDPALREKLFEPFVTGRLDGTGLGLAIVREIALAHGGTVVLAAVEDPVLFELELPWIGRQY